ncbi:MAG: hypothetical protein Q7S22_02280 [Candidatus Micrarchaeota archaeon]|nr:hypothetical protein [Candidatus Micrarchaeota archaeon]
MDFLIDFTAIADSIKLIAVFFSVIIISYAGFVLMTNNNPATRNEWKEIIIGVLIGISIIFLAPIVSTTFTGGGYCSP